MRSQFPVGTIDTLGITGITSVLGNAASLQQHLNSFGGDGRESTRPFKADADRGGTCGINLRFKRSLRRVLPRNAPPPAPAPRRANDDGINMPE
jgi:hypothetical protein